MTGLAALLTSSQQRPCQRRLLQEGAHAIWRMITTYTPREATEKLDRQVDGENQEALHMPG